MFNLWKFPRRSTVLVNVRCLASTHWKCVNANWGKVTADHHSPLTVYLCLTLSGTLFSRLSLPQKKNWCFKVLIRFCVVLDNRLLKFPFFWIRVNLLSWSFIHVVVPWVMFVIGYKLSILDIYVITVSFYRQLVGEERDSDSPLLGEPRLRDRI